MRDAFKQVGGGGREQSEPEILFRQWRSGELSLGEYLATTSHWVAENANLYQPRYAPPLSESLRDYAEGRVMNKRARDEGLGARLGDWLLAVNQALYQNLGDVSMLRWCVQVLEAHEASGLIAKLERQVDILSRGLRTPRELGMAVRCQKLDSDERRRKSA